MAKALADAGQRGVVINADSAQVYADLQVLSARPNLEEMDGIEHRLFGSWDGTQPCSAADWAAKAREEIAKVHADGAVPILVGGTGMYIKILLEGIAPIPEIDAEVRRHVRALPVQGAYAALRVEDPERAMMLEPTDSQRIARALEVVRSTGTSLSDWQNAKTGGIADDIALHPLVMLPPREWLYERCDRRFGLMLEHGAIEEVEALLARKLDPGLPVMRAIGVPEIADFLSGNMMIPEVIAKGAQATRNYAKRQYTWFRNQTPHEWKRAESKTIKASDYFASLLQL